MRHQRLLFSTCRVVGLCLAALVLAPSVRGQDLLKYVPAEAVVGAAAPIGSVLTAPEMEMLPREIISAVSLERLGVDAMTLESAVVLATAPQPPMPPMPGAVFRFNRPTAMPEQIKAHAQLVDVGGRAAYQLQAPGMPPLLVLSADDRTFVAAPRGLMEKMLAADGTSALAGLLRQGSGPQQLVAAVDVKRLRPLLAQLTSQAPPLPPPVQSLLRLPGQVESAHVSADLVSGQLRVTLTAADAPSAQQVQQTLVGALAAGKSLLLDRVKHDMQRDDNPVNRASAQYVTRILNTAERMLQPQVDGADVVLPVETDVASTAVMVGLLLPAVQSAREAARRQMSMNNLKQIALAMHNYHDTYRRFPARASRSDDNKPLLSWRVQLLPFLEQSALYKQFHLDEPWDSPHNRTLIAKMPEVLRSPNQSSPAAEGKTVYLVFDGMGALFDDEQGPRIRDIRDGTSNTIMAVEADDSRAVVWTKPDDLPYDASNPRAGLGNMRPGGFLAGLADGSVRFIANSINPDTLRALITKDGGEVIPRLE